ncbi:MAG: sulfatase [Verrucomicrobiota bacterium JB023]|nr:sulfatase [Verrucomicrobiota bacterium JB023]
MRGSLLLAVFLSLGALVSAAERPNIILIFADDLGYGDLGCYGGEVRTPGLDRLAEDGYRSTDCLVAASVCGPSRAALMTGRYPMRCGHPISRHATPKYAQYGIDPEEVTMAEQLKKAGYATHLVGKWHLGLEVEGSHPLDAGFDSYYGISGNPGSGHPLMRDRAVADEKVPGDKIAGLYTEEAVKLIMEDRSQPFFLYLAHHIAHLPLVPSAEFRGRSGKDVYADFVLELDDSVARIRQAVEAKGLAEETLIVFLSDNGPAYPGSAAPLSGGKYVTMEGGMRVPAIFHWPGRIPRGQVSDALITSMDLFPLFSALAKVPLPEGVTLDGRNIIELLEGRTQESPHRHFLYYNGLNLQAVRDERWKLHFPRSLDDQPYWAKRAGANRKKIHLKLEEPLLFDLVADRGEKRNVYSRYPEVVSQLNKIAAKARLEIGDVDQTGSDQRPHGLIQPNLKN